MRVARARGLHCRIRREREIFCRWRERIMGDTSRHCDFGRFCAITCGAVGGSGRSWANRSATCERCAESWEVVDHGADQSIVAGGPLAGRKLHDLVVSEGAALFGRHYPQRQFPLLLKFLDCQQTLSVQVHPNDEQGAKLDPPDLGKTEAWIVLAAEPGSKIYAGLKPGVDRAALKQAIEARRRATSVCTRLSRKLAIAC